MADENIPKRLVTFLRRLGVDVVRLQELGVRGISDKDLVKIANSDARTILTRDSDFMAPGLLPITGYGVVYISYQPSKEDTPKLVEKIIAVARNLEPKPGLLVIIERDHIEVYD